MSKVDLYQK